METILLIAVLFLLPVFPFTLISNRYLAKLRPTFFAVSLLSMYIVANLIIYFFKTDLLSVKFLALFSILFYSFRLLSVSDLKIFILYLYSVISSSIVFLAAEHAYNFSLSMMLPVPFLLLLLILFKYLSDQICIIHQKSIGGTAQSMPTFSIFFIISFLGIEAAFFSINYKTISNLTQPAYLSGFVLILSWIFISWSFVKVFEWLIYGTKNRDFTDLNQFYTFFSFFIVLVGFTLNIYFALEILK